MANVFSRCVRGCGRRGLIDGNTLHRLTGLFLGGLCKGVTSDGSSSFGLTCIGSSGAVKFLPIARSGGGPKCVPINSTVADCTEGFAVETTRTGCRNVSGPNFVCTSASDVRYSLPPRRVINVGMRSGGFYY